MASAGKALLGGVILGIVLVIALETIIALAFLSIHGVKNPFQFVESVISSIPQLSSINLSVIKGLNLSSLKNVANVSSYLHQRSYVNVSSVVVVAKVNVNVSQHNSSESGSIIYKQSNNGFDVQAGSVVNYTFSFTDFTQFPMKVSSVEASTPGFDVLYVFPKLPYSIDPKESANFTAIIKTPDSSYSGPLQINASVSTS